MDNLDFKKISSAFPTPLSPMTMQVLKLYRQAWGYCKDFFDSLAVNSVAFEDCRALAIYAKSIDSKIAGCIECAMELLSNMVSHPTDSDNTNLLNKLFTDSGYKGTVVGFMDRPSRETYRQLYMWDFTSPLQDGPYQTESDTYPSPWSAGMLTALVGEKWTLNSSVTSLRAEADPIYASYRGKAKLLFDYDNIDLIAFRPATTSNPTEYYYSYYSAFMHPFAAVRLAANCVQYASDPSKSPVETWLKPIHGRSENGYPILCYDGQVNGTRALIHATSGTGIAKLPTTGVSGYEIAVRNEVFNVLKTLTKCLAVWSPQKAIIELDDTIRQFEWYAQTIDILIKNRKLKDDEIQAIYAESIRPIVLSNERSHFFIVCATALGFATHSPWNIGSAPDDSDYR